MLAAYLFAFMPIVVLAQQPPYDIFPAAEPSYYRVRHKASTTAGALIYPGNYKIWIPERVKTLAA